MKKAIVGVALALTVVTGNAAADGIDTRPHGGIAAPPPYIAPSTWSGFYIGAGVGGGAVNYDVALRDVDFGTLASLDGLGGDGVFGTAIVGWDWQLGAKSVLGVFVDYDFSDISTEFRAGDFRASLDHDDAWSVGARLGLLSSPSTLWYATGGYTEARFESSTNLDVLASQGDQTFSGWFAGAGVDTQLAFSNWYLRLEYRFTQFDNEPERLDEFTFIDVEPSMHSARATLTYKFSGLGGGWGYNSWGGWGR